MVNKDLKLVFLGTPDFAVPFLQALTNSDYRPVLVITQPDEPVGRRKQLQLPEVKVVSQKENILVSQPKNKKELAEILNKYQPDICVLVAYGEMINQKALEIPRFGFVNVHPSLLPKYRGPSPIQTAILNGEKFTGITIMLLDQQMDHGPILAQKNLEILPTDNNETLHQRLAEVGSKLLVETLPKYLAGEIKPSSQDDSQATATKIIQRENGQINWADSAEQIGRQFRAFYPWPGVFSQWADKRLKIADLSVLEGDFKGDLAPGEVFLTQNEVMAVKCGQGAIMLKQVHIEGKKEVSAEEFLRGYKNIIGSVLK